ncbi:MAG: hypothetical protein ABIR57_07135 [Aeromicrobium sp.]
MAEEQEPAKKIEKRVVKKTVAKRPSSSSAAPTVKYGRPGATPVVAPTRPQPAAKAASAKTPKSPKAPAAPRPSLDLGKKAGSAARSLGRHTGRATAVARGGVKSAGYKVGDTVHSGYTSVRAFRLPRIEQTRAAAIVGAIIGLTTVGITVLLRMMFSNVRGVSTGGGTWGSLTVVVVAFVAFAFGEFLLARMHVRQPRLTSFLGLALALIVIMGLFLGLIYTVWACLIMPLLVAASFAVSHRLIAITDSASREVG